jgi:16S rRNA (cytidine1402-2'-O)-methyltransferase
MKNKIGKLYIIATPIGNLLDITLRALETLKMVDLILCEDSRVTSKLLRHYDIDKKLFVYNDHSDENSRKKIIRKLEDGLNIALVSDAGTPLISDPGYKLIQDLKDLDIAVETLPGPCSIIAALTIAGLPTDRFMFIGFLPNKISAKKRTFMDIQYNNTSFICFESANRLIETLELLEEYFSMSQISVVREITKLYEEVKSGSASEIKEYYQNNPDKLRGEIVLVIGPLKENEASIEIDISAKLSNLMEDMSLRDAVEAVSSQYSIPKKQVYKIALELKK